MFTRHKFMLITVKKWLKSVLNYRSYRKNRNKYPFFDHPVYLLNINWHGKNRPKRSATANYNDNCQINISDYSLSFVPF